jgi:hypothetical protein
MKRRWALISSTTKVMPINSDTMLPNIWMQKCVHNLIGLNQGSQCQMMAVWMQRKAMRQKLYLGNNRFSVSFMILHFKHH